jgi:transposase
MLGMGPNTHRAARLAFTAAGLWDGLPDNLPSEASLRALLPQGRPRQQVSSVEPWREQIGLLEVRGLNVKTIHDRLKLDHPDFCGSYDAVKGVVRAIQRGRPVSSDDVVIPVETDPGDVAQVDFAYVGEVLDPASGVRRKAWVFVMTLGFSRHFFAWVVFDQSVATWLDLHVRAFAFFGGVPNTLVPDNLKAAVTRAAFGVDQNVEAQRDYRDLARHYGFVIDAAPPRSPKKKGKVERNIQFVEGFLESRDLSADVNSLNADLSRWNSEIAAVRVHGTTRRVPLRVFEDEERGTLHPLPHQPWVTKTWRLKEVASDAHVRFERRLYSVPWGLIGQKVMVEVTPGRLRVWQEGTLVAEHDRHGESLRSTTPGHLPSEREAYAKRSPDAWKERAAKLGSEVGEWANEQLTGPVSRLRVVQATVLYLEVLPEGRAQEVCRRAREFGITKFGEIKRIVDLGMDRKRESEAAIVDSTVGTFARPLDNLFRNRIGGNDGWN